MGQGWRRKNGLFFNGLLFDIKQLSKEGIHSHRFLHRDFNLLKR